MPTKSMWKVVFVQNVCVNHDVQKWCNVAGFNGNSWMTITMKKIYLKVHQMINETSEDLMKRWW